MIAGFPRHDSPRNEPVGTYAPGTPERASLTTALRDFAVQEPLDIVPTVAGRPHPTGRFAELRCPHDHARVLARVHLLSPTEAAQAAQVSNPGAEAWARMDWHDRAAVFLKAADILAGPQRARLNAATMLGQSKNVFQAEIDAACELIDFWRFNVHFLETILAEQPADAPGETNTLDWRPLEGFVLAISPFNFTAIGGNLAGAPSLCGNRVLWKPSPHALLSNYLVYQLLLAAGLPPGAIDFLTGDAAEVVPALLDSPHLAGVHFTGSTAVFRGIWRHVGERLDHYRQFPRLVGETGGKNFVWVHPSADLDVTTTALIRGAFEYQGQKCSAAARAYVPASLWPRLRKRLADEVPTIKVGDPTAFDTFMGAVIHRGAFERIGGYIDRARAAADHEMIAGGGRHDHQGWFIDPTVVRADDPQSPLMREEIFGPVLAVYVYPDERHEEIPGLIDTGADYGLTGAVIAEDRQALVHARSALAHAAGNLYLNDKPTGAVVGRQPFGGGRASGTNDKAGSRLNLLRWLSPRAIKENRLPPRDWRYPHMEAP